jgi:hypothetical protein
MEIVDQRDVQSRQDVEDVSCFITKKKLVFGLPFLNSPVILGYETRFSGYKY